MEMIIPAPLDDTLNGQHIKEAQQICTLPFSQGNSKRHQAHRLLLLLESPPGQWPNCLVWAEGQVSTMGFSFKVPGGSDEGDTAITQAVYVRNTSQGFVKINS